MIKVFENYELATVGQFQSVLEAEGIQTHLKNQFMSGALGEIPFVSAVPELWILNDEDFAAAKAMIEKLLSSSAQTEPEWTCVECDAVVDGVFGQCWKCSAERPPEPG
jgi:hypothetical protein